MENFHIKKISEVDTKKLIQFYENSFQYEKSLIHNYNWRFRSHFNNFEPLVMLAKDQICGHAGLISVNLKIHNKIEKAIWFTDFYISQQFRSKGLGKILTKEWMKICPTQITLCNDVSLKVFKKLGWMNNNNFTRRIKICNYLKILPIFRKTNKSFEKIECIEKLKIEELNINTISKIVDLNKRKTSNEMIQIVRDESWFKWRIQDCPYKKNLYILSSEEDFYIVNFKVKNNLKVFNIIFSTNKIDEEKINLFEIFSKKNNFDYISYISSEKKITDNFNPLQKNLNFAFNSNDKSILRLLDEKFKDIQLIDSDIDYI